MTTGNGTRLWHLGREFVERDSHACLVSAADALVTATVFGPPLPACALHKEDRLVSWGTSEVPFMLSAQPFVTHS
jgi:hypothetical protein